MWLLLWGGHACPTCLSLPWDSHSSSHPFPAIKQLHSTHHHVPPPESLPGRQGSDALLTHLQMRTLAQSPVSPGHRQSIQFPGWVGGVQAQCVAQRGLGCDQFPMWHRMDGPPASVYPELVRCGLWVRPGEEQR